VAFVAVERRVPDPLFRLELFRIRMFAAGNIAASCPPSPGVASSSSSSSGCRGIWLPLHGFAFEDAPLLAAVCMLPMTGGFLLAGPLSDGCPTASGARFYSTGGMLITRRVRGAPAPAADFDYPPSRSSCSAWESAWARSRAPNTAFDHERGPPEHRGASSGMRATFQNVATT